MDAARTPRPGNIQPSETLTRSEKPYKHDIGYITLEDKDGKTIGRLKVDFFQAGEGVKISDKDIKKWQKVAEKMKKMLEKRGVIDKKTGKFRGTEARISSFGVEHLHNKKWNTFKHSEKRLFAINSDGNSTILGGKWFQRRGIEKTIFDNIGLKRSYKNFIGSTGENKEYDGTVARTTYEPAQTPIAAADSEDKDEKKAVSEAEAAEKKAAEKAAQQAKLQQELEEKEKELKKLTGQREKTRASGKVFSEFTPKLDYKISRLEKEIEKLEDRKTVVRPKPEAEPPAPDTAADTGSASGDKDEAKAEAVATPVAPEGDTAAPAPETPADTAAAAAAAEAESGGKDAPDTAAESKLESEPTATPGTPVSTPGIDATHEPSNTGGERADEQHTTVDAETEAPRIPIAVTTGVPTSTTGKPGEVKDTKKKDEPKIDVKQKPLTEEQKQLLESVKEKQEVLKKALGQLEKLDLSEEPGSYYKDVERDLQNLQILLGKTSKDLEKSKTPKRTEYLEKQYRKLTKRIAAAQKRLPNPPSVAKPITKKPVSEPTADKGLSPTSKEKQKAKPEKTAEKPQKQKVTRTQRRLRAEKEQKARAAEAAALAADASSKPTADKVTPPATPAPAPATDAPTTKESAEKQPEGTPPSEAESPVSEDSAATPAAPPAKEKKDAGVIPEDDSEAVEGFQKGTKGAEDAKKSVENASRTTEEQPVVDLSETEGAEPEADAEVGTLTNNKLSSSAEPLKEPKDASREGLEIKKTAPEVDAASHPDLGHIKAASDAVSAAETKEITPTTPLRKKLEPEGVSSTETYPSTLNRLKESAQELLDSADEELTIYLPDYHDDRPERGIPPEKTIQRRKKKALSLVMDTLESLIEQAGSHKKGEQISDVDIGPENKTDRTKFDSAKGLIEKLKGLEKNKKEIKEKEQEISDFKEKRQYLSPRQIDPLQLHKSFNPPEKQELSSLKFNLSDLKCDFEGALKGVVYALKTETDKISPPSIFNIGIELDDEKAAEKDDRKRLGAASKEALKAKEFKKTEVAAEKLERQKIIDSKDTDLIANVDAKIAVIKEKDPSLLTDLEKQLLSVKEVDGKARKAAATSEKLSDKEIEVFAKIIDTSVKLYKKILGIIDLIKIDEGGKQSILSLSEVDLEKLKTSEKLIGELDNIKHFYSRIKNLYDDHGSNKFDVETTEETKEIHNKLQELFQAEKKAEGDIDNYLAVLSSSEEEIYNKLQKILQAEKKAEDDIKHYLAVLSDPEKAAVKPVEEQTTIQDSGMTPPKPSSESTKIPKRASWEEAAEFPQELPAVTEPTEQEQLLFDQNIRARECQKELKFLSFEKDDLEAALEYLVMTPQSPSTEQPPDTKGINEALATILENLKGIREENDPLTFKARESDYTKTQPFEDMTKAKEALLKLLPDDFKSSISTKASEEHEVPVEDEIEATTTAAEEPEGQSITPPDNTALIEAIETSVETIKSDDSHPETSIRTLHEQFL
ncbi:MAG: hypothetical protein HOC94_05395, partial [Waddliaceae bacterium]|nr:hypothetical protein [Waddliaceae bacterium]